MSNGCSPGSGQSVDYSEARRLHACLYEEP